MVGGGWRWLAVVGGVFERVALAEPTEVWCQSAVGVSAVGPPTERERGGWGVGLIPVRWVRSSPLGSAPGVDFRAVGPGECSQAGVSHLRLFLLHEGSEICRLGFSMWWWRWLAVVGGGWRWLAVVGGGWWWLRMWL